MDQEFAVISTVYIYSENYVSYNLYFCTPHFQVRLQSHIWLTLSWCASKTHWNQNYKNDTKLTSYKAIIYTLNSCMSNYNQPELVLHCRLDIEILTVLMHVNETLSEFCLVFRPDIRNIFIINSTCSFLFIVYRVLALQYKWQVRCYLTQQSAPSQYQAPRRQSLHVLKSSATSC